MQRADALSFLAWKAVVMTSTRTYLLKAFLLLALFSPAPVLSEQGRPNILFAFADDWGCYASAYAQVDSRPSANDVVRTPHFDRLARNGVLFTHAFVTAPSCTPCRSSLLSGQYFFRTGQGAILQGAIWDPAIPSYPLLLGDAGYHIGETYKVWSPGTPRDAPYGSGLYGFEKAGRKYNQFSQNVTRMVEQGMDVETAKQVLLDEVAGNFQAFLDANPEEKPFCYWFGPTLVHRKWIKGSGKKYWDINPDDLEGKLPSFLPDVHTVREDFADYLGEVQAFDAGLGVLLEMLRETGKLENTIVVVSGDHGAPGFPGGKCNLYDFGVRVPLLVSMPGQKKARIVDDLVNLMDLAPTFLEMGGVDIPDVMTGRSLVPVLESRKSGQVDPGRTWVITGRERHVARARDGQLPYPQRALRTTEYLYIINFKPDRWPMGNPYNLGPDMMPDTSTLENNTFVTFGDLDGSPTKAWIVEHRNDEKYRGYYEYAFNKRPGEELYVLADDPDQVHNVAGEPDYAEIQGRLRQQLLEELKSLKDPRVLGDGSTFDKPPFAPGG
jgi:N-sulfoglucosamine sulfohydrolase